MKLQQKILSLVVATGLAVTGLFLAPAVNAACDSAAGCVSEGVTQVGPTGSSATSVGEIIKIVVNIMLFILGAVCVVMIVIGGIRYATSQGEQSSLSAAKNTILYAVVGLVVAIAAYAIVNFVIGQFVS